MRLGLAGGGTDVAPYCDDFGGQVMNATIDKYAYASLEEGDGRSVEFEAVDHDAQETHASGAAVPVGGRLQLLKGVYNRISRDYLDGAYPSLRLKTFSDAPPGSGLGSSSTMVVALVQAFVEYFSLPLGEYEVAHLAYAIERNDLALAGGKQDQYAAAFGGFNFMEFHKDDRVIVNPLRIKEWVWAELEASLVLYFTGVSRSSAAIIDEQSKNVASRKMASIDSMHRLKREATAMKEALLRGNLDAFARTLQAGWEAKKGMAASITNPLIDRIEVLARDYGALATKVSGAGGGGFMMFMCTPENRLGLIRALSGESGRVMEFHFSHRGAMSWQTK
ncbi:GHMP family kinase ATP-binding protein [Oleiagrimonas citrea]|uniref:GHMP family kinase ATP-binding protein n=1 Tax=Oleiagrimonas citrea TaxID=1665687 RepID=UPI001F04BEB8|nr:dehydrogenase [Oleiagrimonas citrea]